MHSNNTQKDEMKNQNNRMKIGNRKILKFTENGKPYQVDTGFPGIGAITRALENHPETKPVKMIADLAGLGKLNNNHGREFADACLFKTINIFADTLAGSGCAGSPSGDEFWAVMHPGSSLDSAVKNAENIIRRLQKEHEIDGCRVRLNARVLISRNHHIFSDGEQYLKLGAGAENKKIQPGTIRTKNRTGLRDHKDYSEPWAHQVRVLR